MTSLYNLSTELSTIRSRLLEVQDDEQAIADTIEGEAYEFEQKVLACGYVCKEIDARIAAKKLAIAEMRESIFKEESRLEKLKDYVLWAMTNAGMDTVKGTHFDVRMKRKVRDVIIEDEEKIPCEFMRKPEVKEPAPVPDKAKIREAIIAGKDIPGAKLGKDARLEIR